MRTVHWLFAVSVALFISGIGFVIAGARASREAEPQSAAAASATTPVADIKQIMAGIVSPAATVVFDSVSTTVTLTGVEEKAPANDEEWAVLAANGAALAESGNLLLTGNRAVDQGDWATMAKALTDAGIATMKAAQAKNTEAVLAAGEVLNTSCDNCHRKYQRS